MADYFFYGTLCHAPLLSAVLGREVALRAATLADHAVFWAKGQDFPVIVAVPGAQAKGVLLQDVSAAEIAQLDFYEGGYGYHTRLLAVNAAEGTTNAQVFFPSEAIEPGAPWRLSDWQTRWGPTAVATAGDIMALMGIKSAQEVARRRGVMQVRGSSRVRAVVTAPATLRRQAEAGDVNIQARRQSYANFFAVEEYDLSYRRFDGRQSDVINRAVFISGDAVTVLPYDVQRDRVLLIEQFRAGPMARGDAQPWLLEAIAGRVDPGESPVEAARREAVEEAGLVLGELLSVGHYYPSPGAKSEYLYSYVALCDLPDDSAGVFGVDGEAEDIRGHLISFHRLMQLVENGEVDNAPLLLTALWLQRERARLRRTPGAAA